MNRQGKLALVPPSAFLPGILHTGQHLDSDHPQYKLSLAFFTTSYHAYPFHMRAHMREHFNLPIVGWDKWTGKHQMEGKANAQMEGKSNTKCSAVLSLVVVGLPLLGPTSNMHGPVWQAIPRRESTDSSMALKSKQGNRQRAMGKECPQGGPKFQISNGNGNNLERGCVNSCSLSQERCLSPFPVLCPDYLQMF